MQDPVPPTQSPKPKGPSRRNPALIALMAIAAVLLALAVISTLRGRENQDRLGGNSVAEGPVAGAEERCASQRTYDLIKRELFRRAAQLRGSDQAAFDRLAAYSTLRVESPVVRGEEDDISAVSCSASLALDLPPGVAVVGGRRSLTADIDYTLQAAADGTGDVVTLANAEAIVTPLATLARVGAPVQTETVPPASGQIPSVLNEAAPAPVEEPRQPLPTPDPPPQPEGRANPSFNCINARTAGEIAVCNDEGLAALDRQMAAQFGSALVRADPAQRALLQRTRTRFLRYRDGCRSDSCIADAYRGRMREISDIMAGRWRP